MNRLNENLPEDHDDGNDTILRDLVDKAKMNFVVRVEAPNDINVETLQKFVGDACRGILRKSSMPEVDVIVVGTNDITKNDELDMVFDYGSNQDVGQLSENIKIALNKKQEKMRKAYNEKQEAIINEKWTHFMSKELGEIDEEIKNTEKAEKTEESEEPEEMPSQFAEGVELIMEKMAEDDLDLQEEVVPDAEQEHKITEVRKALFSQRIGYLLEYIDTFYVRTTIRTKEEKSLTEAITNRLDEAREYALDEGFAVEEDDLYVEGSKEYAEAKLMKTMQDTEWLKKGMVAAIVNLSAECDDIEDFKNQLPIYLDLLDNSDESYGSTMNLDTEIMTDEEIEAAIQANDKRLDEKYEARMLFLNRFKEQQRIIIDFRKQRNPFFAWRKRK